MTEVYSLQRRPRRAYNELHRAAEAGSAERTVALLSGGSIDIDQQDPKGATPLMITAIHGHSPVARILLSKEANVSIVGDGGYTALHISAQGGHLPVSKMLMEAGADLEAKCSTVGNTPLHLAAYGAHYGVIRALIQAGANPNSRNGDGSTPLYAAAQGGQMGAIDILLQAKANPLLTGTVSGQHVAPLEIASQNGHLEVVRGMIKQVGIEGCGGASGGGDALCRAAMCQHVDIMRVLTDAGVVDTGQSLIFAAGCGHEASVKLLLQQDWKCGGAVTYVNSCDELGRTPLLCAFSLFGGVGSSPRIVRLLVDAGADTTSAVRLTGDGGRVMLNGTPLALTSTMLRERKIGGQDATQEQLHRLEGVHRLLLRVEAVHAVSLLWPVDISSIVDVMEDAARTRKISTSVILVLPTLRRRAARPRVLLASLFRLVMMLLFDCATLAVVAEKG